MVTGHFVPFGRLPPIVMKTEQWGTSKKSVDSTISSLWGGQSCQAIVPWQSCPQPPFSWPEPAARLAAPQLRFPSQFGGPDPHFARTGRSLDHSRVGARRRHESGGGGRASRTAQALGLPSASVRKRATVCAWDCCRPPRRGRSYVCGGQPGRSARRGTPGSALGRGTDGLGGSVAGLRRPRPATVTSWRISVKPCRRPQA